MKKVLLVTITALVAVLSFASCKKVHTCTCKIHIPAYANTTGGIIFTYPEFDTTAPIDLGKLSNADAKSSCEKEQTTYETYYRTYYSDSSTVNCSL